MRFEVGRPLRGRRTVVGCKRWAPTESPTRSARTGGSSTGSLRTLDASPVAAIGSPVNVPNRSTMAWLVAERLPTDPEVRARITAQGLRANEQRLIARFAPYARLAALAR